MAIEQIPVEVLTVIFELVVHSGSITDMIKSSSNVKLSHVNSLFRAVAIDNPALWRVVSNQQSLQMLRLCIERSKLSNLRVVLLLVDFGTDSYIDFLEAVIPLSSRWEEFYFETGRSLTDYWPIIYALPNYCHGLQLPNLSKLSLLYPDPTYYETDWDYIPAPGESGSYVDNAHNPRNHFYSSWVTPKLRHLLTRNTVPYHIEGAELTTCEVTFKTSCWPTWTADPLMTMYPHWAGLKSLTILCGADSFFAEEEPLTMGTIVLPLLESLCLSFSMGKEMHFRPWLLDILDFPNVVDIDVRFTAERVWSSPNRIQDAAEHVRAILHERTDYPRLEKFRLTLATTDIIVFTSCFERKLDIPNVWVRFASIETDSKGCPITSPDPLGVESVACTKALSDVLRSQSGWQGLSEMTIVKGSEDKADRVRAAFPGWTIHHLSRLEELEFEAKYAFADEYESLVSKKPVNMASGNQTGWVTLTATLGEDDLFVSEL